jgi:hypothetical protein
MPIEWQKETSGQATLEVTLFLVMMVTFVAWAINLNYFISFVKTIHAGAEQGVSLSAQGDLTDSGKLPGQTTVTAVANNETSNTNRNPDEAQAQITTCSAQIGISGNATRCSDGSTADFVDPEATSSPSHGQFYANAVTIKQNFSPFFSGTILGHAVMPFSAPQTYTHTVYMRALNE